MANNTDSGILDAKGRPALYSHIKHDDHQALLDSAVDDIHFLDSISPAMIQRIQEKNREWEAIKSKGVPLRLMDLPVDVLQLIVNEIVYTNDLIALALTHSAFYKLAVPNIYSRFDIVWPDSTTPTQTSKSVDALSYGLATLCLPNRFAEKIKCPSRTGPGQPKVSRRLINSDYAQYVRKFSIGNGPSEWTSEYLITKESGKMLGTLVAIAVSKMVNLESFVWDMPTGVLSDIFMALSSLDGENGQTKFEKIWIRWHDNRSTTPASSSASSPTAVHPPAPAPPQILQTLPPGDMSTPIGNYIPGGTDITTSYLESYADSSVEYPTFSILPSLKSLTVLNIDELSYLDEMAVLIERSVCHLRELQVGISKRVHNQDFVQPWDGTELQQVDHNAKWPGESRIPITRLGGVLGVLVGRVYDIHRKPDPKGDGLASEWNVDLAEEAKNPRFDSDADKTPWSQSTNNDDPSHSRLNRKQLDGKLKLQKLSLERVPLSISVCLRAIDWSNMTSLTILKCKYHEALWKAMKRQFQPSSSAHGSPEGASVRYHLCLKYLHTDQASPELISFLKETIAPNTMETIYLQDRQRTPNPSVTLEQVFKYTVKRHSRSLRKLLIDSSDRTPPSAPSGRWEHWVIKTQFLSYITSGRMRNLKELGMAIEIKDWHMLLQGLPQLANLHTLYIPGMTDPYGARLLPAPREFALNIVDVISLRREIRLVYVGLWYKCFEITEVAHSDSANNPSQEGDAHAQAVPADAAADDTDDESTGEMSDDGASEPDSFVEAAEKRPQLGLREIMYCDDRVGLFQARHGKL